MLAKWMLGDSLVSGVTESQVRVGRHDMHCLKTGSGPDLLLLHGLLGTAVAWAPVFDCLRRNSTLYAVDALGIGGSDRVSGLDTSLLATAERTVMFMDAAGIDKADLVGTSHGASVAMTIAAEYPARVRSLVLHAPANPFSDLAEPIIQFYRSRLGRWFAQRIPTLPRHLQNLALGRMYGDSSRVGNCSIDYYVESLRVPGTVEHVLGILDGWAADMRYLLGIIGRLKHVPTLLVWGTRDRAVSLESAEELLKRLEKSELVHIPGVGHLPYEEAPELFTGAVSSFLSRQERRQIPLGPRLVRRRSSAA